MTTGHPSTPVQTYLLGWLIGIIFAHATHAGAPWWLIAIVVALAALGLLNAIAATYPRKPQWPVQD